MQRCLQGDAHWPPALSETGTSSSCPEMFSYMLLLWNCVLSFHYSYLACKRWWWWISIAYDIAYPIKKEHKVAWKLAECETKRKISSKIVFFANFIPKRVTWSPTSSEANPPSKSQSWNLLTGSCLLRVCEMWRDLVSDANFLLQKVVEAFNIILAAFELLYLAEFGALR